MTKVSRIDVGRLGSVERTPQGGVRVPAYLSRVGVQEYIREDGSIQREYRPEDEVFSAASIQSAVDATVTDFHQGMVNPANYRKVTVGHVSGLPMPTRDGDFLSAQMVILDANEIALVDAGERVENSCGYDCVLDMTPGVSPSGEAYDAVQRNITINHVALLPRGYGRAGSAVQLRLDAKDAPVMRLDACGNSIPLGGTAMAHPPKTQRRDEDAPPAVDTHVVDAEVCATCGAPVDAEGKFAKPEVAEEMAAEDRADSQKRIDTLQAQLDTANETIAALKAGRTDSAASSTAARVRAGIERTALKVGIAEDRLDALDDAALKREVIGKVFPKRSLEGRSDAYLEATFDAAREVLATGEFRQTVAADVKPRTDANQTTNGDPLAAVKDQLRKEGAL